MRMLNKPFLLSIFFWNFLLLNFYMFFYYLSPEFEWRSFGYQFRTYAENGLLFFTIGFVLSVLFAVVIGWPLYLLAKLNSIVNYATCGLGGAIVAVTPYAACILLGWNAPNVTEILGLFVFVVLALCGYVSGTVFYYLTKIKQKNKVSECRK